MMELEELEQIAKAGKRAETDYGQSFIRRRVDQSRFEDEFTPDVILSLIRELKITLAALGIACETAETPEQCVEAARRKLYPKTEQPK